MTPPTLILRHRRENLKKCSLTGLEAREDLLFFTYPHEELPPLTGYLLLKVGAPPLTEQDAGCGLLLIDGTWRLAAIMEQQLQNVEARRLPGEYHTAYPRKQTGCPDPIHGLASIEALYLAHYVLGRPCAGLLDRYHWKERFLQLNELK